MNSTSEGRPASIRRDLAAWILYSLSQVPATHLNYSCGACAILNVITRPINIYTYLHGNNMRQSQKNRVQINWDGQQEQLCPFLQKLRLYRFQFFLYFVLFFFFLSQRAIIKWSVFGHRGNIKQQKVVVSLCQASMLDPQRRHTAHIRHLQQLQPERLLYNAND